MIHRLVLDTNVLVAGLSSRRGASFQLLRALRAGAFVLTVSVPLWFEYESVLKRAEVMKLHGLSHQDVELVLNALAALGEPVDLNFLWRPQLRDPLDEMVLETALNGRATALVTFNVRDFKPAAKFTLPVLVPSECLSLLRSQS